jgi:AraC-like DNA-binding protein
MARFRFALYDNPTLQFLKQLRLQEARRLMRGDDLDAAEAGYRVGYDDASHFNREYNAALRRATDVRRRTTARARDGVMPTCPSRAFPASKSHPSHRTLPSR